MGGRPSQRPPPYSRIRTPIDSDGLKAGASHHLPDVSTQLREELERWRTFRKYQWASRRNRRLFTKVKRQLQHYWHRQGLRPELQPRLQFRAQDQNAVEEWKEFYLFQHQRLARMEERIEEESQNQTAGPREADRLLITPHLVTAKRDWESWNKWLQWIEEQLSVITADSLSDNNPAVEHVPLRRSLRHMKTSLLPADRPIGNPRALEGAASHRDYTATTSTPRLRCQKSRQAGSPIIPRRSKRIAQKREAQSRAIAART